MQSKDLLKMHLQMCHQIVGDLADTMEDAPLTFPTPNGGNHPTWVLGHVAYSEGSIIHAMMLGEPHPLAEWKDLFGQGSEPTDDASAYPSYAEVRAKYDAAHADTLSRLEAYSEEDLDAPTAAPPEGVEELFATRRQCFHFAGIHKMMHRAQIADARRAAGRAPIR